jgi:pSer/pThr/pTyr-binding forkhead associated (FHA) protein
MTPIEWAIVGVSSLIYRSLEIARDDIIRELEHRAYSAARKTLYPTMITSRVDGGIILPRSVMITEPILAIGSAPTAHLRHADLPPLWGYIVRSENAFMIHRVAEGGALLRINGEPMNRHYLKHGDLLTVGTVPMIFGSASARAIEKLSLATTSLSRSEAEWGLASAEKRSSFLALTRHRTRPEVLVVTGGTGTLVGTSIPLGEQHITVGRAADATLVLTDDYASKRHARLYLQSGEWIIEDLGSTNGTYLDRQKVIRPTPVPTRVPVRIGKTVLELR